MLKTLKAVNQAFTGLTPLNINSGKCYIWAAVVHRIVPTAELFSIGLLHAFVRIGDRYYDAERLKGVKYWRKLPASCACDPAERQTIREFSKHWMINSLHSVYPSKAWIDKLTKRARRKIDE